MPTAPVAQKKKQRPRKQVRLRKRKLAEAAAGADADTVSEDEDSKAAKEHQPKKSVEKSESQEKRQSKPQQKSGSKKRKAEQPILVEKDGKKPRLPKNKRAKVKAAAENPEQETEEEEGVEEEENSEVIPKKEPRFIVFIGNLPYTATKAALEKHFAAVQPKSVRIISQREDPNKCKGFAFLEFEGYDRMQSCLLKFHHTIFNDGSGDRKINVELTAGGGGKSEARKTKLETKNQKLDEQRKRKVEEEEKLKAEKKAKQPQAAENESQAGVHPSRRRQVR